MGRETSWMSPRLLLAVLLALAAVAAAGHGASAQPEPRFSRLGISVWPEFDRPMALVIIRGELDPDTALPARLSLRIPAAAGQPSAVASATSLDADPADLEYETAAEGGSLLITLETPDPVVQLEFYLPITREGLQREFTYVWPGDLAADEVTLQAQIPVGAQDFQTEPDLGPPVMSTDGLLYRETTLFGLDAGETVSLHLQYSKEDPRLTLDALAADEPADDGGGGPLRWPVLAAIAAVVLVGIAAMSWYRYSQRQPTAVRSPRRSPPGRRTSGGGAYCTQCGRTLSAGDRFCSRCGAPARRG